MTSTVTVPRESKRFSTLAQASLKAAAELAQPHETGADELVAALSTISQAENAESQELMDLLRSMGVAPEPLRRVVLSEPRTAESITSVLEWADTLRRAEGADEITCPHLLLGALAQAPPGLQRKLAGVSVPTETLVTRALTNAHRQNGAPAAARERNLAERYRGQWFDHRYEVLGGAQGGMGCVLFCQDLQTRQPVAVKLCLRPELADLFLEEARKWILLGVHPHIVRALYAGRTVPEPVAGPIRQTVPAEGETEVQPPAEPVVYIVLEMIARSTTSGCSLRDWLRDAPKLPSAALVRWAFQIAGALDHANAKHGLIHQDVKPENILITPAGDAKLTDFGVATRPGSGRILGGTPIYMAPEHLAGRVSVQSDIYSLGMTLAAGFLPHMRIDHLRLISGTGGATISEQQLALLLAEGRPADDNTGAEFFRQVATFVKTCTNADPGQRYDSFAQMQHALAEIARTHLGVTLATAQQVEDSSADLTNRAISLLRLRGNAEADQAIRFLAQALAESPDNYIALDWLRTCCAKLLNSRQILRLAWFRCQLSWAVRSRRPWLLAQAALLAAVFYLSPAPAADKLAAATLALAITGEAYVRHFSDLTLKWFGILIYAVCGMVYVTRDGAQTHGNAGGALTTILVAMMISVCLRYLLVATVRFLIRHSPTLQGWATTALKRTGLDSTKYIWSVSWPIYLAVGVTSRAILLMLYPYVSLMFRFLFRFKAMTYLRRQSSRNAYLGQARGLSLTPSQRTQRSGYPLLVCVLVLLLYGRSLVGILHWPAFWRLEAALTGWCAVGILARREEDELAGSARP